MDKKNIMFAGLNALLVAAISYVLVWVLVLGMGSSQYLLPIAAIVGAVDFMINLVLMKIK